jgi:hypothetical protein
MAQDQLHSPNQHILLGELALEEAHNLLDAASNTTTLATQAGFVRSATAYALVAQAHFRAVRAQRS